MFQSHQEGELTPRVLMILTEYLSAITIVLLSVTLLIQFAYLIDLKSSLCN